MAAMKIKAGGSWHTIKQPWVKVGGQWKAAKAAWVKVGGQWKPCYTSYDPKVTAYVDGSEGSQDLIFGYSVIDTRLGSTSPSYYVPAGIGGQFLSLIYKRGRSGSSIKYSYAMFTGTNNMPASISIEWRSTDGKYRGKATSITKQTVGRNTRYNFGSNTFSALSAVYYGHKYSGLPNTIKVDIRPA